MFTTDDHDLAEAIAARGRGGAALEPVIIFVDESGARQTVTAAALYRTATGAARALEEAGAAAGEPLLLGLCYSRTLIAALCGAFYRGAVPAVLPYRTERSDPAQYAAQVRSLTAEAGAGSVLVEPEIAALLRPQLEPRGYRVLSSADLALDAPGEDRIPSRRSGDDVAWLQFTSGTTGGPKAVPVRHAAARAFLAVYCERLPLEPDDVMVSWLPLYHDMGLVTALLLPLLHRIPVVLMSPAYWVRSPATLMRTIHELHGTICNMPNFAYAHCTRSIRDRDMEGVDLRSWRRAGCGGEPVRHTTLERFRERFAAYGLRDDVFTVGYGMSENVMAATQQRGRRLRVDWIDRQRLQHEQRAVPATSDDAGAIAMVGNGPPLGETEIRIVDEHGDSLPERCVGEILIRGPYLMRGYHRRPELNAVVLRDGWLHSGDLGYLADGELFICGRKKDLIIVGGHNVHAEEIELLAEAVPGIQPGRVVAFGVADEQLGTERAVIVYELQSDHSADDARRIDREIRRQVLQRLDVALGEVHVVAKGWIIKSSSGKLARAANRTKYLAEREAPES